MVVMSEESHINEMGEENPSELNFGADIPPPLGIHPSLDFIDFNEDGTLLLGSSDLTGKVWVGGLWLFREADNAPDPEKSVCGVACATGVGCGKFLDNNKVIAGEDSGEINLFELRGQDEDSNLVVSMTGLSHDDWVSSISVISTGDKTVSASADKSLVLWDNATFTAVTKWNSAHWRGIREASASKCSDGIVSAGLDGVALLWDTRMGQPCSRLRESHEPLTAVEWVDEHQVLLGTAYGNILQVDLRSKETQSNNLFRVPVHSIARSKSGLMAICADARNLLVWSPSDQKVVYSDLKHSSMVRGLAWHSSGTLYSSGYNKEIFSHTLKPGVVTP